MAAFALILLVHGFFACIIDCKGTRMLHGDPEHQNGTSSIKIKRMLKASEGIVVEEDVRATGLSSDLD